jgi:lysine 2,3-aminomutase
MGRSFKEIPLWKDITEAQWNDWHWQLKNRITTTDKLRKVIPVSDEEAEAINQCLKLMRMAISPYYASLIDPDDPNDPIRKQAVPTLAETHRAPGECSDPLHEDVDSPAPGLTHRYPDRVLFLVTDQCSMYCRHCTRRRFAGQKDRARSRVELSAAFDYIRKTPAVRDVILSGGDPLTLDDDHLEAILAELKKIPHVEIIRIGSRMPVVLPQRVTPQLAAMLAKYHPLWLNVQFSHPNELTPEAEKACDILSRQGIPLGNQSVLLRGVNDCTEVMKKLVQGMMKFRVRPYYIYQCDMSFGLSHFRTSVAKGIEIIECLRGHTSGLAVPTYVVDSTGGGGKIPVAPQYLISQAEGEVILRNYANKIFKMPEPLDYRDPCKTDPNHHHEEEAQPAASDGPRGKRCVDD